MPARGKAGEILEDLISKYELLSRRIDASFGKASASQLIRQLDALTKIARLILSYRSILELEEREEELTRILSELKLEAESEKRAMRTVKADHVESRLWRPLNQLLLELRRIRLAILGEGGE